MKSTKVDLTEAVYPSIWLRFAALLIDGIVLGVFSVPAVVIGIKAGLRSARQATPGTQMIVELTTSEKKLVLISGLLGVIVTAAYYTLLNSSKWQGTVGKKVIGLKIVNEQGGRIDKATALKRWVFMSWPSLIGSVFAVANPVGSMVQAMNNLSAAYMAIEGLIGGVDVRKRTIHDRLANTYVVSSKDA